MTDPSVAAIIVSWNHRHLLPDCLEALLAQRYSPLTVVVVDNGSRDGSAEWLARSYPSICLWAFPDNRGFSKALNWGVRRVGADCILSLNPDVKMRDQFVAELVQALYQDDRIGMAAPKLLRADEPTTLDSTGLFIDRRRRPYDRGQGQIDQGQYDNQLQVFGACGAAAMYRQAMLDDLAPDGEYFDEDLFAYYEDADLAWRAQARGWRGTYAPRAVASHDRGWGDTLRKRGHAAKGGSGPRLALRNRYLVTIKNDSLGYFLKDLPLILAAELPRLAYAAVTRPAILCGLVDLVRLWPSAMRRRRQIRRRRTVDPAVVRRWFVAPARSGGEGDRR